MPRFRILIEGSGIELPREAAPDRSGMVRGFFVSRIVNAPSPAIAASRATAAIASEWSSGPFSHLGMCPRLAVAQVGPAGLWSGFARGTPGMCSIRAMARLDQEEDMKNSGVKDDEPASELITKRIAELGDWRGETLGRMRKLIREADPGVVEEWKWMGTPVWSHDGIICTGESYKKVVKLTFAKGASLKDPARLFNSSLDGNVRRAIDIAEGEVVDESAFKTLIRQAVALNSTGKAKPSRKAKS
jgi:hypothetical protein